MPIRQHRLKKGFPGDRTQNLLGELEAAGREISGKEEDRVYVTVLGEQIKVHRDVFAPIDGLVTLIAEHIGDVNGKTVLDLGTGTGINAIITARGGAIVTATDIKDQAVKCASENIETLGVSDKVNLIHSDLFEKLGDKKFDLIIFTPSPRWGVDKSCERAVYLYDEHALRFLEEAPEHLNRGGRILFRHSFYPAIESSVETHRIIEGEVRKLADKEGFELKIHERDSKIKLEDMLGKFLYTTKKLGEGSTVASDEKTLLFELTKP